MTRTPSYRFNLRCPRCGKASEHVAENREPSPVLNCGDCLMDATEVVEFVIVSVEVLS
jgi:uncharacterized Zn finger protein